jgi:endoplasmic reticulum-Golgi intermediate compartment protein 3
VIPLQETVDHLFVNTTRSDKLKVSFDFSFPEIPCNLLSIDAMDDTGAPQLEAVHNIYKFRLDERGERDGDAEKHELGDSIQSEKELEILSAEHSHLTDATQGVTRPKCGNCYGAGKEGECCNTCDSVKDAYERIGWRFTTAGIAQCESENFIKNLRDQFAEDGGCRIFGQLVLNKASGHFHVAPHKKLHQGGMQSGLFNLMDLIAFTFDQFNITHTIHMLSFGDQFPGIKSPLDNETRKLEDTHGMYQYYVKVVPTKYKYITGKEIESNQYAVTEHMRHLSPGSGMHAFKTILVRSHLPLPQETLNLLSYCESLLLCLYLLVRSGLAWDIFLLRIVTDTSQF